MDGSWRRGEDVARRDGGGGVACDARQLRHSVRGGELAVHHHGRGGTIAQAWRIASSDRATFLEGRHQFCQGIQRAIAANGLIFVDCQRPLLLLDLDGYNLFSKAARLCSGGGALVALQREAVLLLARDAKFFGDDLRFTAHVYILEGAPQAIVYDAIDELAIAQAVPRTPF